MAKKVKYAVDAHARKNLGIGGAWLATFTIHNEATQEVVYTETSAWTNANACKRWFKALVLERTSRKTIKATTVATGENDKATAIQATLIFSE